MNILETLIKLRDDIKLWVTNNLVALNAKIEANTVPIDSELKIDSTNPVQNKVVTKEINDLNNLVGETPVAEQIASAIASQPGGKMPNITDDESGEFNIADPNGNVIFRADAQGIHTTNISATGEDFNIADELGNVIFKADKDGIHTTNINTNGEDFNIADSQGNIIFKVDPAGAHTTDITIDGVSIKGKMAEWDNGSGSGFSGDYNDLVNKPELSDVATSGDYNDLINAPNIQEDESGELLYVDEDGNIIAKVDAGGIKTTKVTANDVEVDGVSLAEKIPVWDSNTGGAVIDYGTTLPSTGVNGQIFLLRG